MNEEYRSKERKIHLIGFGAYFCNDSRVMYRV